MEYIIKYKNIEINLMQRTVFVDKKEVFMTHKEFELLCFLIKNPDELFSRDDLLKNIWEYDSTLQTRTVDIHIKKIRDKIKSNSLNSVKIITIYGLGYKLI